MSKERKYQSHEVERILDLASDDADAPAPALPAADGLTLLELHEVAREAGLPPDRITQAVAVFEGRGELVPRTTTFGLPTSVGSIIHLPRNPSDHEWELLVAELRTTFGVSGEMTSQGGLRQWSDGTLHAFIEPTATGYRLRLVNSSLAVVGMFLGGALLAIALVVLVVLLGKASVGFKLVVPAFLSLLGGGLLGGSALSLPGWAREQEKRMEQIGKYAVSLLALPESRDD
jgi:hypothetical protein